MDVTLPAPQGLGELRQFLRRALRLDLPLGPHGTFDAVPPDGGHQLGGLLRIKLLERLREADEREAAHLAGLGRIGTAPAEAECPRGDCSLRQEIAP